MGVPRILSARRLNVIDKLFDGQLIEKNRKRKRYLDIGCRIGKDFVTFFEHRNDVEIFGLDLKDYGLRQNNFNMIVGDAAHIPFPDSYFDIAVSIGTLEHIVPIEKLARVAQEINRVSKSYVVVVPSVSSIIEPHSASLLWHLRDWNKKPHFHNNIIYMSDEAWLAFGGFKNANSCRLWHIPPLIANLAIYKTQISTDKEIGEKS